MAPARKCLKANKNPCRKKSARKGKKAAEPRKIKICKKGPPGSGLALYQACTTPAWLQYMEELHFMGLPGEIRDLIASFVLPIDFNLKDQSPRNIITLAGGPRRYRDIGSTVHPFLQTCRQLRYEYGALLCETNIFHWAIPADWNSSRLTYFTQFAASVGCQDYHLTILINDDIIPELDEWCDVPGRLMKRRWANLKQWARDVFDGVETRVLLGETEDGEDKDVLYDPEDLASDDCVPDPDINEAFIVQVLDEARLLRGTAWPRFEKRLEEMWKSYHEGDFEVDCQ